MTQEEFFKRYEYNPQSDFLGGGGFGEVFKAKDIKRDRFVAIKEAKVSLKHKFSLKREVELANEIEPHNNVAVYQNCFRFILGRSETDFAIMKFYEHGDLDNLLATNNLSQNDKHDITLSILEGIQHLHNEKIIHRDLKPGNILMDFQRGKWIPKITDYGLSRLLTGDNSVSNSSVGKTPLYTAPEIFQGNKILANIDIWAAGIIFYKLFVGEVPFNSSNGETEDTETGRQEIYKKINDAILPDDIFSVPEPYQTIIEQCLIKDNKKRPQKVKELIDILKSKTTSDKEETTINSQFNSTFIEDNLFFYDQSINSDNILGIDLTYSHVYISVSQGNSPQIISNNRFGKPCLESNVDFNKDEDLNSVIGKITNKLKKDIGVDLKEAIVSIPNHLNLNQKKKILEVFNNHGVIPKRLLTKTQAIALAYGYLKDIDEKVLILSIDNRNIGISVFELGDGVFEEKSTIGQNNFIGSIDLLFSLVEVACFQAGVGMSDIDKIIINGGYDELQLRFKNKHKNIHISHYSFDTIAKGLAIQAGVLRGQVKDVLSLFVINHSIGIETSGGKMSKLLYKDTTIPTKVTEAFSTAADNQTSVEIHVLEGESDLVKDNSTIGRFHLDGILPAKKGVPQIELTCNIDANGILLVTAKDLSTNEKLEVRI